VIYETHLPALSRHASAQVEDESHRGTYAGACSPAVLNHLERLDVAVEFLPLHASDPLLGQDWGYFSTSFRAMREAYAVKESEVNQEVMAVVDAMHGCGIPVLLDVVFNHGGELWVKA
jgi:isoamylase